MKLRGIILKEIPFGESNKYVRVLAKGIGKITLKAKNSKSIRSKISAASVFSYCDFLTDDRGKTPSVKQADVINSFFGISYDIEKLSYASYLVELTEKISFDNQPCDDILYLLIMTLSKIECGVVPPALAARIFDIKFIQYSGFTPQMSYCCRCSKAVLKDFLFSQEGIVCGSCRGKFDISVDYPTIYAIKYILSKSVKEVFDFGVSDNVLQNLGKVCRMLIRSHFEDLHINSFEFIKSLRTGQKSF